MTLLKKMSCLTNIIMNVVVKEQRLASSVVCADWSFIFTRFNYLFKHAVHNIIVQSRYNVTRNPPKYLLPTQKSMLISLDNNIEA